MYLEFPNQCPDSNLTESLWQYLTLSRDEDYSISTKFYQEKWGEITPAQCSKLAHTYSKRIAAVIEQNYCLFFYYCAEVEDACKHLILNSFSDKYLHKINKQKERKYCMDKYMYKYFESFKSSNLKSNVKT